MDGAAMIQKLWNDISNGELDEEMRRNLEYIYDLLQSGWSINQAVTNVGELRTQEKHFEKIIVLSTLTKDDEEDEKQPLLRVIRYQMKNTTKEMSEHYQNKFHCSLSELETRVSENKITDYKEKKDEILDATKDFLEKQNNKVISDMVYGSVFVAIGEVWKLISAWDIISSASNLLYSNRSELSKIESEIQRMRHLVTDLVDTCERDPQDTRIIHKALGINLLFNSATGKISQLRVKIGGQIEHVNLRAGGMAADGVSNLVRVGSQGFQLYNHWDNLTICNVILAMISIFVSTCLAVANAKMYFLSKETLENLRKDFDEVDRWQNMLNDLCEQSQQAVEQLQNTPQLTRPL